MDKDVTKESLGGIKLKNLIILIALCLSPYELQAKITLKFLNEFKIPAGEKFQNTEIGGLSGIVYDHSTNKLLSITHDRSVINPARFYEFNVELSDKVFIIRPHAVTFLQDNNGHYFKKHSVNFGGVALFNGQLLISSAGAINQDPPIDPSLLLFSREGKIIESLPLDSKYLPSKNNFSTKVGPRDKMGLQGLTVFPDNSTFMLGMEEALLQDDQVTSVYHASKVRFIVYKNKIPMKEVAYQLDVIPQIKIGGLVVGENGVTDLLALNDKSILTIERSRFPLAKKYNIKIFEATGIDEATDISSLETIKNKNIISLNKNLILDFNSLAKPADNIEGMCFGPTLPNGHQSLILVSDNNFNKDTQTTFLIFELINENV